MVCNLVFNCHLSATHTSSRVDRGRRMICRQLIRGTEIYARSFEYSCPLWSDILMVGMIPQDFRICIRPVRFSFSTVTNRQK